MQRHRSAIAAVALGVALVLLSGLFSPQARADGIAGESISLAVIAAPAEILPKATAPRHKNARRLSLGALCLHARSNRDCDAVFAAALRSSERFAGPPTVTVESEPATQPLRFHRRASWVRRLETIGKEGLPFVRMPRGPQRELIVGINRDGVLGFSLNEVSRD